MYYIVSTTKNIDAAARDLEVAIRRHSFGVLHVLDLQQTLTEKGYPLDAQCRIYEVCNPQQATRVLQHDIRLNMVLPCRISVFEDKGITKIGAILPAQVLRALSLDRELGEIAMAVEETIKSIIDNATAPLDTRAALLARRAVLAEEVKAGAEKRRAERSGNVPDSGELASDDVTLDVTLAEIDRDAVEIEAIDAALERLDSGTYGRCTQCGEGIPRTRLAQHPEAARCVSCEASHEQDATPRRARL